MLSFMVAGMNDSAGGFSQEFCEILFALADTLRYTPVNVLEEVGKQASIERCLAWLNAQAYAFGGVPTLSENCFSVGVH
jgi:hypothetical protein